MDDCIFNPLPSAVILSVFVKQLLFFCIAQRCDSDIFESQGGSVCIAFCGAILLSANTVDSTFQQCGSDYVTWSGEYIVKI